MKKTIIVTDLILVIVFISVFLFIASSLFSVTPEQAANAFTIGKTIGSK